MSQKEILTRAKQGDSTAINFLINQALKSIGIKAKTNIQTNNLYILLEAVELPNQEICIKVIYRGIKELQVPSIDFVNIYGRILGDTIPQWTEVIELSQPTIENSEEVGAIFRESKNTNSSQESSTKNINYLTKKTSLSNAEIVHKKSKQEVNFSFISLNKFNTRKSDLPTAKKSPSLQHIYQQFSDKQYKFIGLLGAAITILLVPIYTLVVNSQPRKLNNIFSNTSSLRKINQSNTSVAEVNQSVPGKIPTPETIKNPQVQATDFSGTVNQIDLSEVSEFILSAIKSPINSDNLITIKAVGDIIPGTNYPRNKLHPRKQELFASVKPLLQDADIIFGNFESTLTSYRNSRKRMGSGKVFAFRTPPEYRNLLKDAGFNVLSVANNHSFDFFQQGFEDTITNIETVGMQAVGRKGEIIYRQVKGINIGFIAFSNYSYHNSMLDLDSAKKLVQEADKKADIIVISVHAGAEGSGALRVKNKTEYFFGENRGNKVLFAHELIDEGADLVLGHGPHVPRAMEVYQGKLIAYSLGNFMGYRTLSSKGKLGYSLVLELDVNSRGDFVSGKILPVHLNSKGIPYRDKLGRSIKLIRELTKKDFPKTMLEIDGEGRLEIKEEGRRKK